MGARGNMATYLLTSKKIQGSIELSYLNGVLTLVKFDLKQALLTAQWLHFREHLSLYEENINNLTKLGFVIAQAMPANEQIALFCRLYENRTGVKYKVSPADAGKMKGLKLSNELLECYFASENFLFKNKYSIANLAKYYNELRVELANRGKSHHPNYWDASYEAKLKTEELPGYWAHLRSLGLEAKKDRTGKTIGWIAQTPKER